MMTPEALAKYFDHTLLNPAAVKQDIIRICDEALSYGFYSVCVNPVNVKTANEHLRGSDVKVCSVVGFPLGADTPETKAHETAGAVADGADEIDMVINIGALKENDLNLVEKDIKAVVTAAQGKTVKVIIETCMLDDDEKIKACQISEKAGARFVKTSTGFAEGGASVEDVRLMKKTVGDRLKVKASGGIKTLKDAITMIDAGADRIGASAGVDIIKGFA
jgi:deoxyribose-phosphate aldolase